MSLFHCTSDIVWLQAIIRMHIITYLQLIQGCHTFIVQFTGILSVLKASPSKFSQIVQSLGNQNTVPERLNTP